eukprot:5123196-Lingulodinium_polyedra.AAC.1
MAPNMSSVVFCWRWSIAIHFHMVGWAAPPKRSAHTPWKRSAALLDRVSPKLAWVWTLHISKGNIGARRW